MIKLHPPTIVGKIDLSKIPKDSLPVKQFHIWPKLPETRDKMDSGWAFSFTTIVRNYNRYMNSIVKR